MDFGLARQIGTPDSLNTASGTILGTPAYMSPGQVGGKRREITGRSDIYSLGVILYQLLTNRLPFVGTVTEILGEILHTQPAAPSVHNAEIDPFLEIICLRAMARDVSFRYRSMDDMIEALGEYLDGNATVQISQSKPVRYESAKSHSSDENESIPIDNRPGMRLIHELYGHEDSSDSPELVTKWSLFSNTVR